MFRTAVLLLAAFAAPAAAQPAAPPAPPVPVAPPAPPPLGAPPALAAPAFMPHPGMMPGGLMVSFATVRVADDKLLIPVFKAVTVVVEKEVTVIVDGNQEKRKVQVTEIRVIEERVATPLADAKLSDAAGKAIPAERAAELLKEDTPVVMVNGGEMAEKYRKLFREGTVFVTMTPKAVPFPGGPAPLVTPAPVVRPLPTTPKLPEPPKPPKE